MMLSKSKNEIIKIISKYFNLEKDLFSYKWKKINNERYIDISLSPCLSSIGQNIKLMTDELSSVKTLFKIKINFKCVFDINNIDNLQETNDIPIMCKSCKENKKCKLQKQNHLKKDICPSFQSDSKETSSSTEPINKSDIFGSYD